MPIKQYKTNTFFIILHYESNMRAHYSNSLVGYNIPWQQAVSLGCYSPQYGGCWDNTYP